MYYLFIAEMMEHPDFIDNFGVHTRWIESDFQAKQSFSSWYTSRKMKPLVRTFIEIDGRRHQLALPAQLLSLGRYTLRLLASTQRVSGAGNAVTAPISGILHSWLLSDGDKVNQGDVNCIMGGDENGGGR